MMTAPSTTAPPADRLLASLDAEQWAAATLPDGPAQVIAPAGSGKTTTLIAGRRLLAAGGRRPDRGGHFNRDAAADFHPLASGWRGRPRSRSHRIRTIHARRAISARCWLPVRWYAWLPCSLLAARTLARSGHLCDVSPPEPPDPGEPNHRLVMKSRAACPRPRRRAGDAVARFWRCAARRL